MPSYALIGPGDVVVRIQDESTIDLTAGVRDGYSWRIVENVTVDNSTLEAKFTNSNTVQVVEPTRLLRTTTITDMTQGEIDAVVDAEADDISQRELGKSLLSVFRVLYGLAQQINPAITPAQFKTFVDNETAATDISAAAFKTWLADQLR